MKFSVLFFSAAILACSCNSKSKAPEAVTVEPVSTAVKEAPTTAKARAQVAQKTTDDTAPEAGTASAGSGTLSSESNNTAKARKGWSKTAKGAVIGGVVGAGTGAAVNKKNRVAGAVIGGAAGAGAGAIIGNEMDKKDGRH